MEEESFKKPILPALPPTEEEKSLETKKVDSECPYHVPKWSGSLAPSKYSFEVLKNGVIIEEIKDLQTKPYWVIGRLPLDIVSAHPTTSRYHCIIQYRPQIYESEDPDEAEIKEGWFVYDLDSTHGTFINKNRIRPKTYVRLRVGHQLKFGNSTRAYIFQGPTVDEEEESEFTVTELKQQRVEREIEKENEEKVKQEKLAKEKENEGISWGLAEDAEEEPDLTENPFAVTNNEEIFIDDPKKTLRGYFEREGHELDYRCDELSPGVFICRIELPIDDEVGNPIVCEVQHKGKKKECVVQCALEACRILDRHGVLRQSHHEPRRSKKVTESDSDDDTFFDRTGDVEKKRLKKIGHQQTQEALTFEQLTTQETEILDKITSLELKLELMIENEKRVKQQQDTEEDLDAFVSQLSHDKIDKFGIRNIKMELQNLKLEHGKIQKLINIAKPSVVLPSISQVKSKLPLFGKRNKLARDFGIKKAEIKKNVENEFEVEEEDEEEVTETKKEIKIIEKIKEIPKAVPKKDPVKSQEKVISSNASKDPIKPKEPATIKNPLKTLHEEDPEPSFKKPKLDESEEIPIKPQSPSTSSSKSQEPAQKKNKSRKIRSDRYRANIDMNDDEEYIDEEKLSMWVAPDDQRGDGMTHLNDKFGY